MPDHWPALVPGYTEWPAPSGLRAAVTCLWAQVTTDSTGPRDVLVLPDACSDLIWEQGVGAYIAGPDTGPVPGSMSGGTVLGVRFRPAAGGPVLGVPLHELRDLRAGLADVLPAVREKLPAGLDPGQAAERILALAGALVADADLDRAVTAVAMALRDPRMSAEDAAADMGLSPRQMRRRFHAAVGYGPKTLQRILRFRRFVSSIDAGDTAGLAALAAETGYADQAHLTRECTSLAGMSPAALAKVRARH